MNRKEFVDLPSLNIPYSELKIEESTDGELYVYDIIRKKNVILTPEEFVRQLFLHWLVKDLGYPLSHITNELSLRSNNVLKRSDSVIYGPDGAPLIIIEFKAPDVEITQDTFDQIVRYNNNLQAKYLIVSNGLKHYCCKIDYNTNSYHFIRIIPHYKETLGMPGIN